MKKLLLILVPLLLFFGCSGEDPIAMVKKGTLQFDTTVTVGDALSNYKYFSNTKWSSFEDSQKRTVVEFSGDLDFNKFIGEELDGVPIKVSEEKVKNFRTKVGDLKLTYIAQFSISKTDNSFNVLFSGINMSGTNHQTGKHGSTQIPDKDLNTLQTIYRNKPEVSTLVLLIQS